MPVDFDSNNAFNAYKEEKLQIKKQLIALKNSNMNDNRKKLLEKLNDLEDRED